MIYIIYIILFNPKYIKKQVDETRTSSTCQLIYLLHISPDTHPATQAWRRSAYIRMQRLLLQAREPHVLTFL